MKAAIVIHGRDDHQGRALFVTSALYQCVNCLRGRTIRYVAVDSLNVEIAAQVLAYDHGLEVEISSVDPDADPNVAFRDAALYVAVVFRDGSKMGHLQASALGVPSLLAVQFPYAESFSAELACNLSAAHDTSVLASRVSRLLGY